MVGPSGEGRCLLGRKPAGVSDVAGSVHTEGNVRMPSGKLRRVVCMQSKRNQQPRSFAQNVSEFDLQIEKARQWKLVVARFPIESRMRIAASLILRSFVLCAGLASAYALAFLSLPTSFPIAFYVALLVACAANVVAVGFSREANMTNPFWSDYVYWASAAGLVLLFVALPAQHSLYDPLLFTCLSVMFAMPLPGYLLCAVNLQQTATVRQIRRYLSSLPEADRERAAQILLRR